MKKLFSDDFALLRHAQYQFEDPNNRRGNQLLTNDGKEQCKKLGFLLANALSKVTNKILFVTSPIERAVLTTHLVSEGLEGQFEVEIQTTSWLSEHKNDISDDKISRYLQKGVFVIFVSHYPDISKYMRTLEIGHCEFISNNLHIKNSIVLSEKLSNSDLLEKKVSILHQLLAQEFDLNQADRALLELHGIDNIDKLKNATYCSDEFNTELIRIRTLLLTE